jgi:uncharacterized MAPEG superfamily protein
MPIGPNAVVELKLLGVAVLIGVLQLMWAAVASQQQRGFAWAAGPRDEEREVTGVAARLQRAMVNYLETFPLFTAVLLAAILLGHSGPMSLLGAWLYVIARAVYVPLYAAGVPMLRSIVWCVAMAGIVLELVAVL